MTLRLPLNELQTIGGDCLVAMLQVEGSGPILGGGVRARVAPPLFPKTKGPAFAGPFEWPLRSGPGSREDPGGLGG